jgi:YVTN family beta-propeller protein
MNFRISWVFVVAAFVGVCLLGSAQSLAQNAYITNRVSNSVSVIDTRTNAVTATIPISGGGPFGPHPGSVAVSPDGSKVYIANLELGTVSVIDTATNTVTATIPGSGDRNDERRVGDDVDTH